MKNSPFEGRALVCDMDGTLLNSKRELSADNQRAIERFTAGGGKFTVATGRRAFAVKCFLDRLPVNIPAILLNGAVIHDFDTDRVLWERHLDEDTDYILYELKNNFPDLGIEIFNSAGINLVQDNKEIGLHRQREIVPTDTFIPEQVTKPWHKILLAWEPEKIHIIEEFLKDKTGNFYPVQTEPEFLELISNGTSKGHALEELSRFIQIPICDIVAVGDNLNDMELIQFAGKGIAVDNAHEKLKANAYMCCCHHDEHAVAQVIEWIEAGII